MLLRLPRNHAIRLMLTQDLEMATRPRKPPPKGKRKPKRPPLPLLLAPRGRARLYADCPVDLVNKTKAAAAATATTVAELVQRAVAVEIARLEAERGTAFPTTPTRLRVGRPPRKKEGGQ